MRIFQRILLLINKRLLQLTLALMSLQSFTLWLISLLYVCIASRVIFKILNNQEPLGAGQSEETMTPGLARPLLPGSVLTLSWWDKGRDPRGVAQVEEGHARIWDKAVVNIFND